MSGVVVAIGKNTQLRRRQKRKGAGEEEAEEGIGREDRGEKRKKEKKGKKEKKEKKKRRKREEREEEGRRSWQGSWEELGGWGGGLTGKFQSRNFRNDKQPPVRRRK